MSIDPIKPYLPIVALALILAVLFGGRSWGKASQKAADAAIIAKKDKALLAAADAFGKFAIRFREIDAATAENERQAQLAQAKAAEAVKQSERERKAADKARATLEAKLRAERSSCADGERPVCGVPLR